MVQVQKVTLVAYALHDGELVYVNVSWALRVDACIMICLPCIGRTGEKRV